MLPFLDKKKIASIVMLRRKPGEGLEPVKEEGEPAPELMQAAEDLLSAIAMKNAKGVASALEAAFAICDSMPHVEGEHEDLVEDD